MIAFRGERRLRVRVLIVGGGEVGYSLAQALSVRHDVLVIDQRPEVGDRFESLDVEFVSGGGTVAETLTRAGADRADLFIGCTGLDEVNIVACALANQFGSAVIERIVIVFMFLAGAKVASCLLGDRHLRRHRLSRQHRPRLR